MSYHDHETYRTTIHYHVSTVRALKGRATDRYPMEDYEVRDVMQREGAAIVGVEVEVDGADHDRCDFVNDFGNVVMRTSRGMSNLTRMILKPKEVFHTFDGVVFKEGLMVYSRVGHWYLSNEIPPHPIHSAVNGLRRISLIAVRLA